MYLSLQACRAAAAALVVLFHLGGTFAQDKYFGFKAIDGPFAWGDAGVDFFFVLSGFLITWLHRADFGQPRALGGYLRKRTLRIYPTYWLVCALLLAAALAVPSLRAALPGDAATLLKALALLPQDPARVGGTGSPILFVAWSLQYEMLFYLVIAAAIVSRAAGGLIALGLLGAQLACQTGSGCGFPLSFLGSPLVLLFALGVASAWVVRSRLPIARPLWLAVAAIAGFVAFGLYEARHGHDALPFDRRLIYGGWASLIIVGLVRAEDAGLLVLRQRWQRWVGVLGDASYALYLLHIPIISVLCKLLLRRLDGAGPATLTACFFAVFLACVALAVAFHLAIERPMLGWLQRAFGGRRAERAPAARLGSAPPLTPPRGGLR